MNSIFGGKNTLNKDLSRGRSICDPLKNGSVVLNHLVHTFPISQIVGSDHQENFCRPGLYYFVETFKDSIRIIASNSTVFHIHGAKYLVPFGLICDAVSQEHYLILRIGKHFKLFLSMIVVGPYGPVPGLHVLCKAIIIHNLSLSLF